MAVSLTHKFAVDLVAIPDGPADGKVHGSDWNDTHLLEMGTNRILGRTTADPGDVEEITVGSGLSLSAGQLTATSVSLTAGVTGILPGANGGTGVANTGKSITIGGNVTLSGAYTFTGTLGANTAVTFPASGTLATTSGTTFTSATFAGASTNLAALLTNAAEVATVAPTVASGIIEYDVTTQSVLYYTEPASANWTVNFRASSGTTLNTAMSTGQAVTVAFLVTQGSTAFYNNSITISGSTTVTVKYQGGTAWTAGNASSIEVYTYTIIKTGTGLFTVLASKTKYA